MFQWNEEMVRFMRDASEYSDYHRRLVQWMLPDLHPGDHICDAGCGLGYLSLALSPYVRRVTAADRSQEALSVLRENCSRRAVHNIDIRPGDIRADSPDAAYDAMVFCFFGSMEEILAAALRQCRGTVLTVVRDDVCHRFSGAPRAPDRHSFDAACGVLDAHGIPYTAQRAALDFPQPFRTLEDARTFLTLYGGGAPAEDDLRAKLISTGDPDFPWQLPGVRRFGMIAFSTEEGEHI